MEEKILQHFEQSSRLVHDCGKSSASVIMRMARELINCFERGGKLLLFGNGGSAAQAQHFAAELVNKLSAYRKALPAIALTTDSSVLTSIGNDINFSDIFSRHIEALGRNGDVAWGMSTSGNSFNLIKGFTTAHEIGMLTIAFSGSDGGIIAQLADLCLTVPSHSTAQVQEVHLCAGHVLCELIEEYFLVQAQQT